ncbi:MAG: helix-turn-helix domain-containing protein [Lutispora sp.]|nr:helix-turn-helix domain-containing protein [Lutispora sp.]
MEIVKQLESQGVFLLKGPVQEVAKHLKTSETTIYRYLNKTI